MLFKQMQTHHAGRLLFVIEV